MTCDQFSVLYGAIGRRFAPLLRTLDANSCQSAVERRITGNATGVSGFHLNSSMRRTEVIPRNGGETPGTEACMDLGGPYVRLQAVPASCHLLSGAGTPSASMFAPVLASEPVVASEPAEAGSLG